jgi:hypothetical protein
LKNCLSKFYKGIPILRKVEGEIMVYHGPDIFIQEENAKRSLNKIFELVEKKRSESLQDNIKI